MIIDRYKELELETKSIIGGAFVKAFNKSRADFVLLMARGGYNDLFPYLGVASVSEPVG